MNACKKEAVAYATASLRTADCEQPTANDLM